MSPDDFENSISDDATDAGVRGRSSVAKSLGDEGTLGDFVGDQETVIDDIEVIDLESRYKVESTLGRGGMGEVFLAVDTRLGRKVAIKQILGDAARSKIAVSRFLTEAKSIAAIGDHPNIIQLYEFGRTKNGPFLIMEYVEGGNLSNHCRERALPLEEAIDLTCQLCDGLGRAHDQGIIHRDIKPANVLLTKDGVPKLTDFGLAKTDVSNHQMTVSGAIVGTPDFMPPEQRRNAAEVDARSDLWSLAATMYQMVTGRSPKIIRFRDVPDELEEVLGTALEDHKKDRFQSAKEFGDALRSVAGDRLSAKKPRLILGKLQEGQCKACGTITGDLTKKFCRNRDCGSSLRVDCLQCNVSIPVWDDVCGECGGNQPKILELKRKSLEELKAQAESLLSEMSFDDAIQLAKQVESEVHPDLSDLSEWARQFQESVETERKHQVEITEQHFADAKKHIEAFDYDSAIHSLGSIRDKFRSGPIESLYVESQRKKKESESLITEIQKAFGNKNFEGLLPKIERAIELCGDREDLKEAAGQLQERAKSIVQRQEKNKRQLLARIRKKVKEAKSDGVIDATEAIEILQYSAEYDKSYPGNPKITQLLEQCYRKIQAEDSSIVSTWSSTTPAVARALVERQQPFLDLRGLTSITPDVARILAKTQGGLWLNGLTSITLDVARALAKHQGVLQLKGLTSITPEAAHILVDGGGDLAIDGLTSITPEVARIFAGIDCDIWFNSLTSITPEVAHALAKVRFNLNLVGLRSITPDVAHALAKHRGGYLGLNGLASITAEAAHAFAEHQGDLWLEGVTFLTPEAASALAEHHGELFLSETAREQTNLYR